MGAWIETTPLTVCSAVTKSHPAWVRGLKLTSVLVLWVHVLSHPAWVRGLKLPAGRPAFHDGHVAPCVGAWIETPIEELG